MMMARSQSRQRSTSPQHAVRSRTRKLRETALLELESEELEYSEAEAEWYNHSSPTKVMTKLQLELEFEMKYARLSAGTKDVLKQKLNPSTCTRTMLESKKWDEQVNKIAETFGRYTKYCACLVGDTDKDNKAVVDALADKIKEGNVYEAIGQGLRSLDLEAVTAQFAHIQDLTERSKLIKDEIKDILMEAKDANVIIFIENIHAVVGSTRGRIYDLIFEAIQSQQLLCIGASTVEDYKEYIASNDRLRRHFERIDVAETLSYAHAKEVNEESNVNRDWNMRSQERSIPCIEVVSSVDSEEDSFERTLLAGFNTDLDDDTVFSQPPPHLLMSQVEEPVRHSQAAPLAQGNGHEEGGGDNGGDEMDSGMPSLPSRLLLLGHDGGLPLRYAKVVAKDFYGSEDAIIRIHCIKYREGLHSFKDDVLGANGFGKDPLGKLDRLRRNPSQVLFIEGCDYLIDARSIWWLKEMLEGTVHVAAGQKAIDLGKTTIICTTQVGVHHLLEAGADEQDKAKEKVKACVKCIFPEDFCDQFDSEKEINFIAPNDSSLANQPLRSHNHMEAGGSSNGKKRKHDHPNSASSTEVNMSGEGTPHVDVTNEFIEMMKAHGGQYDPNTGMITVNPRVEKI